MVVARKGTKKKGTKKVEAKNGGRTYIELVVDAIRELHTWGGSSKQKLKRFIEANLKDGFNPVAFRTALKRGVANNILIQNGQTFRVNPNKRNLATSPSPDKGRAASKRKSSVKTKAAAARKQNIAAKKRVQKKATNGGRPKSKGAQAKKTVGAPKKATIKVVPSLSFRVPRPPPTFDLHECSVQKIKTGTTKARTGKKTSAKTKGRKKSTKK